ncbi:MAG TPA: hypothetical protein VFC61_09720 [Blastocatellia bacterium]|nr:hypothetical protein [Blastocatellia bacterium]
MKTALKWTFVLLIIAAPGWAEAMTVSITATRAGFLPGTATVTPTFAANDSAGNPAVFLACTNSTPGALNSIATNAACTRNILINGVTVVTIRDVSTTNRARVYRVDGLSSDILNLAGMLAISGSNLSAANVATLKITYAASGTTTPPEYTALNYNLYAYTAAMSGNFFAANGAGASACASPTTPPHCLTLKLTANNVTVNQFGENLVATVNVHSLPSGGAFGPPTHPSETKSIACGTINVAGSCKPSLQGELTAFYKGVGETLKVVGGAALGGSNNSVMAHGVIDTFVDVSVPEFTAAVNAVVDYTQQPTLHALLAQDGGLFPKLQQSGNLPLWWNLERVTFSAIDPNTPTLLRSIVSNTDLFDDGAYQSWVPTPGTIQARDLTSLVVNYEWQPDCPTPNSLFVELQLATLEVIKIPLGCGSSGANLVNSNSVQLPNGSITSFKSIPSQYAGADLRAISVILAPTTVDQEVALNSFTIGAFRTTFGQTGSRSPIFGDLKCDFPGLNEFTMRVTPLDANGDPGGPSFIWGDGPGETFSQVQHVPTLPDPPGPDCQLRTQMPVTSFPPHDREAAWRFELLYNLQPVGTGTVFLFSN